MYCQGVQPATQPPTQPATTTKKPVGTTTMSKYYNLENLRAFYSLCNFFDTFRES